MNERAFFILAVDLIARRDLAIALFGWLDTEGT